MTDHENDIAVASAHTVAAGQLRAFIERIERVNGHIEASQEDRKAIFSEAKSVGFDIPAMRTIIRLRKKDRAEREEEDAVLAMYLAALGME